MNNDMETVIWEPTLPNIFVGGGMMGPTKVRMMAWKEKEKQNEVKVEKKGREGGGIHYQNPPN